MLFVKKCDVSKKRTLDKVSKQNNKWRYLTENKQKIQLKRNKEEKVEMDWTYVKERQHQHFLPSHSKKRLRERQQLNCREVFEKEMH